MCVVQAGAYIFNTEAHPMDMSALHCCHAHKEDIYASLDLQRFSQQAILERSRKRQMAVQDQWVPQCQPDNYHGFFQAQPEAEQEHSRASIKDREQHTTTMAVDIEVFDEFQQPAGDVLVSNFERIREERELNQSVQRSEVPRNQLTVSDLDEFFAQRRENFASVGDTLKYVLAFMNNFTMDVAFIRGLQLYDGNITNVLGTSAQKEYESRMRSLWQLYELEQQYAANIRLIKGLGLLSFQADGERVRNFLSDVLDTLDRHDTNTSSPIRETIAIARMGYVVAMANSTAMQEFAHRIFTSGSTEATTRFQPLLRPEDLGQPEHLKSLTVAEERELFRYTRRIVDFRKRMSETVDRLQTIMQDIAPVKSKEVDPPDAGNQVQVTNAPAVEGQPKVEEQHQPGTAPKPSADATSLAEKAEPDEAGGSVWSQFVQTILRKATVQRVKFDESVLLEKTRKALEKYSRKDLPHHLFACHRPEYIEAFAYRDFYPEAL